MLEPVEDDTEKWLRRRKQGDAVVMKAVTVRNAERLALYWVLAGIVAENHEELTHKDAVDEALKIFGGHFEVFAVTLPGGRRQFIQRAKSIAIENMEEPEFEAYFERALEIIHSVLLPGIDVDALRKEAYARSGAKPRER